MTNYRQSMSTTLEYMAMIRERKLIERELSDTELKRREEIAQDMNDDDFKDRYGDRWKEVKMAVATKQAKTEAIEQERDDLIEAGGFSPSMIKKLKKSYSTVDRIDPTSPAGKKMTTLLDKMGEDQLKAIVKADIKFISLLAVNRLIRMGYKAKDIQKLKTEQVQMHEMLERWEEEVELDEKLNIDKRREAGQGDWRVTNKDLGVWTGPARSEKDAKEKAMRKWGVRKSQAASPMFMKNTKVVKEDVEESLNEDNMDLMKKAAGGAMQHIKLKDGKLKMDSFTASAIMGVYDKVNPANKKKIETIINRGNKTSILKLQSMAMKATKKEEVELDEAPKYELYHKDFSSAMQHAYKMAKKLHGITIDPKEIDDKVATGPRKPGSGKTNKYRLKGDKGAIQVQVYNKGGSKPYELNFYKEETEIKEGTWAFPSNSRDIKKAKDFMRKPQPLGKEGDDASSALYSIFGDDELHDELYKAGKENPKRDARDIVKQWLKDMVGKDYRDPKDAKNVKDVAKQLGIKEEVELDESEFSAMAYGKKDQRFVVKPRDTRGMAGKQDKFKMYVVQLDNRGNEKKIIKDLGSHVSIASAQKFAKNRGIIEEVELNERPSPMMAKGNYYTVGGDRYDGGVVFTVYVKGKKVHSQILDGTQDYEFKGKKYKDVNKAMDAIAKAHRLKSSDFAKVNEQFDEGYLELEFKDKRKAEQAYNYINNKIWSGGNPPYEDFNQEGNSLQIDTDGNLNRRNQMLKDLKKELPRDLQFKVAVNEAWEIGTDAYRKYLEDLTPMESARSDAMRAMRKDKSMIRGKDSADVDDVATDTDRKAANKNILQQLKKSLDTKGKAEIEFLDKKKKRVPYDIAVKVVKKYMGYRKSNEKGQFQAKIAKSYRDMLKALKEDYKPQTTILDRIDVKIQERKNG